MTTSIDTLIADARSGAADITDAGIEALQRMQDDIDHIGSVSVFFTGVTLPTAPDLPDPIVAPVLSPVDLILPTEPGAAPALQPLSPIDPGAAPVFSAVSPTISLPGAPAQLAEFSTVAPDISTDYAFPDVPDQLLDPTIAEPTLGEYFAPVKPTISLPSFEGVAPTPLGDAPTDLAAQTVAAYREVAPEFMASLDAQMDNMLSTYNPQYRTQLARIEAQLATYLEGGTGMSAAVETAIYERSRAKQNAEARRVSDAAFETAASRGFTIPPGAAIAGARAARQAAADNNAAAAREIVVLAMEQEQKNLQFAVTTSAGLRTAAMSAMLSYHGNLIQINGQAIEYAKTVLSAVVQVYNLQVEAFRARLDAYRAEAAVLDARIKAALSYVDLYKAEIDALQALVQVDQAKVAVYRGRIDALQALAGVYKARVDVVVEQAGLERLKLDVYKTKAEVYGVTVQGKRAEYELMGALINGERAKVDIFTAQVGAFRAQGDAYKTQIEAQVEVVRGQALINDATARQYQAAADVYRTIASTRGEVARVKLENQRQEINAWEAQSRAQISTAELSASIYRTQSDVIIRNAALTVDSLIKNAQLTLEKSKAIADTGIAAAKTYGSYAASYLAGMTTLVGQTTQE